MKRRKNAIVTGQSKRGSTGPRGGDRVLVDGFYRELNLLLSTESEIALIPPDQVHPSRDLHDQSLIVADYCVRKILPEMTGMFHWGDKITQQLRALAPVVDGHTAFDAGRAADRAAQAASDAASTAVAVAAGDSDYQPEAAYDYPEDASSAYYAARNAFSVANRGFFAGVEGTSKPAAGVVYYALVTAINADDEAAYNRIIALTNEMLESL